MLEVQDNVLQKFRDGIMVVKKKKTENEGIKYLQFQGIHVYSLLVKNACFYMFSLFIWN